jgi:hypothetical protein
VGISSIPFLPYPAFRFANFGMAVKRGMLSPTGQLLPRQPSSLLGLAACRLPALLSCTVQAVFLASMLRTLPAVCSVPFFQHPSSQQRFGSVLGFLGGVGPLLGAPQPPAGEWWKGKGSSGGSESSVCSCVLVLATCQALLGYLLPALVVVVGEQGARKAFVLSRRHDPGWSREDLWSYSTYDWLSTLIQFLALVLVLSIIVLHFALAVALRTGLC